MPYHIQSSDGKYEVVDDAGKVAGTHPTRKQAIAQLQALYANVSEVNDKDIDPSNDDQRKAVMAKLSVESSSGHGAGWYHDDMSDSALRHTLTDNNFQEGEISAHRATFGKRISKLGLKPAKIEHESDGKKYTRYTYEKKEVDNMDAETEKASSEPGDYLIVEDREKPTTFHLQVRKNGKPDHGLMGGAWAALHDGYRGNKYEGPGKQEAIGKLRKMYEAENMPVPGEKEVKGNPFERLVTMLKGDTPGHPFRGNQYGSEGSSGGSDGGGDSSGASSGGDGESSGSTYRQPSDFRGAENPKVAKTLSEADKHLQKAKTEAAKIPESKRREFSYVQSTNHARDAEAVISGATHSAPMGKHGTQQAQADKALEWSKESLRLLSFVSKEGRRNSATDSERLQQIHDLSVENGAACPLTVTKDAKTGAARWVLISTNAYEDRDGEYVSRKAQKRDVERMNETKSYGPLRLWHLGYPDVEKKEAGPGVDIGDCDYSEMFGKFRVESGTFRNERVAAAIKERSDKWSTSLGFFHPPDEPDQDGTYHEIYTFERSLLPRTKASNYLTPLAAILKENDMTTKEDKVKGLTDLLGDEKLAQDVLGQVDKMEKDAQARGLSYKQADEKKPPAVSAEKSGDKKDGGEPDEDDTEGMDEATAKAYKAMLPHIVKTIHALTKASNMEDAAAREAKASKKEKKARKALEAQVKELQTQLAALNGDLPRGLANAAYRPTQTGENLIQISGSPVFKENVPDPLGDFMASMGMAKIDPAQLSGNNGNGR